MIFNAKIIVGWLLLVTGLIIIGLTIYTSYQFFTAKSDFPAIFKEQAAAGQNQNLLPAQNGQKLSLEQVQRQMQEVIAQATNQAIGNMIPQNAIQKLLNAILWSVFATFLVYAGAKIAEIGTKLIS